jgi:hypothetical protein
MTIIMSQYADQWRLLRSHVTMTGLSDMRNSNETRRLLHSFNHTVAASLILEAEA